MGSTRLRQTWRATTRRLQGYWALLPFLATFLPALGPSLPHYRIVAEVDVDSATVQVYQVLHYVNNNAATVEDLVLHITPARFGSFTLLEAAVEGRQVSVQQRDTLLELPLGRSVAPGQRATAELRFRLQVPSQGGRYGSSEGILALGNWYPVLAVYRGARLAGPDGEVGWDRHPYLPMGDPFFTEVADYDVTVTTSGPAVIAHTGTLESREGNTWHLQAQKVRDFALAISSRYETRFRNVEGVRVTAYYLPGHTPAGELYLDMADEMLRWMAERVGRYPYPVLAIAEVSSWGSSLVGQEYPSLVFIGSGVSQAQSGGVESYLGYLVAHEVAHQWFYAWVGSDQLQAPWLDEALATWLPHQLLRDRYPSLYPALWRERVAGRLSAEPYLTAGFAVDSPLAAFRDETTYTRAVYQRGALFLEEVYALLGEELYAALRTYVHTFGGEIATPTAFLDLLQAHAPSNLNPIIRRYINYPRYQASAPLGLSVLWPPQEPWSGNVAITVLSDAPLARVVLFGGDGEAARSEGNNVLFLDAARLPPGESVVTLVATSAAGADTERARRVVVEHLPLGTSIPERALLSSSLQERSAAEGQPPAQTPSLVEPLAGGLRTSQDAEVARGRLTGTVLLGAVLMATAWAAAASRERRRVPPGDASQSPGEGS